MSILIDEQGRPILLFADQDNKKRTKGIEAYKVSTDFFIYFSYLG